jgi:ParB family transcriptional regulator, chromosome partitioning protein
MARRNIFEKVDSAAESEDPLTAPAVTRFGAARSLSNSIDELARQANQIVEGEMVVEIATALIDTSFVADRMGADDEAFAELVEAIRARGQDSPVLLRPHPHKPGRYQTVFGHRRVRAASALGRPVRAVIKALADIELVLAQGQENSVRANLSFIERVLFAQRLLDRGYEHDIIQSALSIDQQTLSKMLTIPRVIPQMVIMAIGPAKGVGRDRWLELRKLVERARQGAAAAELIATGEFQGLDSDARFQALYDALQFSGRRGPVRKAIQPRVTGSWASPDKAVAARISRAGQTTTLVMKSRADGDFGAYLSSRLGDLYTDFQAAGNTNGESEDAKEKRPRTLPQRKPF